MNGQWTGTFGGTNSGRVTLDIDDRGSYFSGMAHVISDNRALPQVSIGIQTADKSKIFKLRTENVTGVDPKSETAG